ncbi:uncharacterized protein VTP21DRAFT_1631 [Calcarisporiella thermophila]|uniref:uncharacterized protein n=1 Tax=Calcarisporiella thermophila TaxID=911321 RepID=UPI00374320A4
MSEEHDPKIENPEAEEEMFDLSLKKKKKKPKKHVDFAEDLEESKPEENNDAEAPAAEGEEEDMDFLGLKKKKKKKTPKPSEPLPGEEEGEAAADESLDFGEMKKKKPKKKKNIDLEAFEAELREGEDAADKEEGEEGDFAAEEEEEGEGDEFEVDEEAWLKSDRDYTYRELLSRFFKILRQNNPELVGEKRRYTIAPPSVFREGNKKTIFANLPDICKRMHRSPDHVIQFLFAELGTSGSVDGSQRLVIKGRFQQKQIENILRRYIVEYVTCKTCKSPDTILTKENRIFFMQCEACGSTRSVTAIKTGYQAQIGKRPKK